MYLYLGGHLRRVDPKPGRLPAAARGRCKRDRLGGTVAHRRRPRYAQVDVGRAASCADEPSASAVRSSSSGALRPEDSTRDRRCSADLIIGPHQRRRYQ